MARANFDRCLDKTLRYEGGYTNHPKDPGGPTNYGITIHDVRKYVKPDATAADVKALPLSTAKLIYRSRYWDAMGCDNDPAGVDLCTFDSGVNSGVGRAVRWRAAAQALEPLKAIRQMCAQRLTFLHGLKTWGTFGGGWGSRVTDVQACATRMALEAQGKSPDEVRGHLRKEAKKAEQGRTADVTKSAGVGTAGGVLPTQVPVDTVDWSVILMLSGFSILVLAVIGYFAYKAWLKHSEAQAFHAEAAAVKVEDKPVDKKG